MALDEKFLYQPRTMLESLRQRPPVKTFFGDTFFPRKITFTTPKVDRDIQKFKRRLAGYTNPVASATVVEREGFTMDSIQPAYFKEMTAIRVDDLTSRQIGRTIYDEQTPLQRLSDLMGEDLAMLNERLARREEQMRAEALFTGKLIIDAEGYKREVDYGYVPGEHIKVLSGGSCWNAGGDPMRDLDEMRSQIVERCGLNPTHCIVGKDVIWAIINNELVMERLDNRRYEYGKFEPEILPEGVIYHGILMPSMLKLYSYEESYVDSDGVSKSLVPDDAILLGSTQAGCSMLYGLIQNLKHPAAVPRFPSVWENPDGSARFIQLESAPLPNIRQVDAFMVAHVLS